MIVLSLEININFKKFGVWPALAPYNSKNHKRYLTSYIFIRNPIIVPKIKKKSFFRCGPNSYPFNFKSVKDKCKILLLQNFKRNVLNHQNHQNWISNKLFLSNTDNTYFPLLNPCFQSGWGKNVKKILYRALCYVPRNNVLEFQKD